ncbi:MAG: DUF3891 family protein, partial [Acidobacteriaceae bacterium]|nr:DUF3891 family protein [Acidobacteriaceae bacterium]
MFQSRHSILAGDLARCLDERIFGPLPPDVIAAIARHDFGWDDSDERQLKALPDAVPRPFPAL